MDIKNLRYDSQPLGHFGRFSRSAFRERPACHAPVANIAVGDGDKFDVMTLFRPECSGASSFVFGVIGMSTEADDS